MRVLYYVAMSLDGRIAGPGDDLSFLQTLSGGPEAYGYNEFIAEIDGLVVGATSWDYMKDYKWAYDDRPAWLVTHNPDPPKIEGADMRVFSGEVVRAGRGARGRRPRARVGDRRRQRRRPVPRDRPHRRGARHHRAYLPGPRPGPCGRRVSAPPLPPHIGRPQGGRRRREPQVRARSFGRLRTPRAVSSVGRAPARQAGGHWFEPSTAHLGSPRRTGGFVASDGNGARAVSAQCPQPNRRSSRDLLCDRPHRPWSERSNATGRRERDRRGIPGATASLPDALVGRPHEQPPGSTRIEQNKPRPHRQGADLVRTSGFSRPIPCFMHQRPCNDRASRS